MEGKTARGGAITSEFDFAHTRSIVQPDFVVAHLFFSWRFEEFLSANQRGRKSRCFIGPHTNQSNRTNLVEKFSLSFSFIFEPKGARLIPRIIFKHGKSEKRDPEARIRICRFFIFSIVLGCASFFCFCCWSPGCRMSVSE